MYCGKCGSKVEEDTVYCPYCGNLIKENKTKNIEKEESKNSANDIEEIINDSEIIDDLSDKTKSNDSSINNNNANDYIGNNISINNNNKPKNNDGLKNASFVLGLISIILSFLNILMIPVAIIGICLGAKYKNQEKESCPGFVLSIIGLILSFLILIGIFFLVMFAIYDEGSKNTSTNKIKDTDITSEKNYDDYYNYDKYKQQVIGNDKFGYLTISSDWTLYKSSDGSSALQYAYGNKWVLSLYAIVSPNYSINDYAYSIHSKMEGYGATNIKTENVYVGKYQAIKKTAYLTSISSYMTTWCFADEYGNFHYIAINGPTIYSDNYDLVNSFTLTK